MTAEAATRAETLRSAARPLDLAARGGKKLESLPDSTMDEVLAKLAPIFE